MAVVSYTEENVGADCVLVTWANLANGDTGAPAKFTSYADRTMQVSGTFGAGGTVVVQGSLDSSSPSYNTLTDPQGNAISVTSASIETVMELTQWVRPSVTAGDGTTDLTVKMLFRKTSR